MYIVLTVGDGLVINFMTTSTIKTHGLVAPLDPLPG